jgi:NADH:ubiquinone oxidoreductase subunit E
MAAASRLSVDFFILLCDIPSLIFQNARPYHCQLAGGYFMADDIHPQHPDITNEMWKQLDAIIATNRDIPGSVIGVLRECQDIVGYLPVELIDFISDGLNLSSSEVFGVASFYSLFSFEPKGRHLIKVCMGTACYVKGIQEAVNRIENKFKLKEGGTSEDRRFSLEAVRCLGACGLAPVVVVDKDTYGGVKAETVIETLEKYE